MEEIAWAPAWAVPFLLRLMVFICHIMEFVLIIRCAAQNKFSCALEFFSNAALKRSERIYRLMRQP